MISHCDVNCRRGLFRTTTWNVWTSPWVPDKSGYDISSNNIRLHLTHVPTFGWIILLHFWPNLGVAVSFSFSCILTWINRVWLDFTAEILLADQRGFKVDILIKQSWVQRPHLIQVWTLLFHSVFLEGLTPGSNSSSDNTQRQVRWGESFIYLHPQRSFILCANLSSTTMITFGSFILCFTSTLL